MVNAPLEALISISPAWPVDVVTEKAATLDSGTVTPDATTTGAGCWPPIIDTDPPVIETDPASTAPEVRASMREFVSDVDPEAVNVIDAGLGVPTGESVATVLLRAAESSCIADALMPITPAYPDDWSAEVAIAAPL
jgi:hypothetical protein